MKLKNNRLHLTLKPATFKYTQGNRILEQQLLEFMKLSGGIGLAANQVGLLERVFVMNDRGYWNPTILESSSELEPYLEGCLSYPNQSLEIDRPVSIVLEYYDYVGNKHVERLTGLDARVAQHEIDHLNGITMYDRKKQQ